jgi:hypothetical protein
MLSSQSPFWMRNLTKMKQYRRRKVTPFRERIRAAEIPFKLDSPLIQSHYRRFDQNPTWGAL